MNMNDIAWWLGDVFVWTFDNLLVPIGSMMSRTGWEWLWAIVGVGGLVLWLKMQNDYNKKAASDPDQIK